MECTGTDSCIIYPGTLTPQGYGPHREIYFEKRGAIPPGMQVDHRCGNRACINPNHLRLATASQNAQNRRPRTGSSSRYKGVSWHKRDRRWQSFIRLDGKDFYLGQYVDEHEAARAYDRKALELFGEFARLNFPAHVQSQIVQKPCKPIVRKSCTAVQTAFSDAA